MEELKKIAEALGLDASADQETILTAITTVLAERDTAKADLEKATDADGETLEDRAKREGKIVVEAETLTDLTSRLKDTETSLADADFEKVYDAALKDPKGPRVDAAPETKERFRKLYDQDRDTTVSILENSPHLANAKPAGEGGSDEIVDTPKGVDADMAKLDKKVKARMREDGVDYVTALDAVQTEQEEELV